MFAKKSRKLSIFDALERRIAKIRRSWQSSLSIRTVSFIVLVSVLGIAITGTVITHQVRNAVFERTVSVDVERFATHAQLTQEKFSVVVSPTTAQSQRVALEVVASLYDPARELLGGVLLRSPHQEFSGTPILEPETVASTRVRSLVTPDLRELVGNSNDLAWQSVATENTKDQRVPGVVVGKKITIPGSGDYELYAVFSLENQQDLLNATIRALLAGMVGLLILLIIVSWGMTRFILRPIRAAAANAQKLTEGDFNSRMHVHGSDELAQLGESFNTMASSLEEQFTKLERMSAVQTNFVSAVSHELRSPVTTIRMAGQLIYDKREDLPNALKRSAELQHTQLRNLDAMLSDLLEISRYDAGGMSLVPQTTDIAEISQNVIDMADPLAIDNGVVVRMDVSGDTHADVEPRRIERVIRNLVVNALEHAEGKPVQVSVIGGRDAVAVRVQDNGVGLSPDQAEHVFDRFWRADSSRVRKSGGTGLGLTIAKEDALIHGGTLEAIGELGVGSTFLLTIPRKPGEGFTRPLPLEVPEPFVVPGEIHQEEE
ncbi:MtrAB system histidine kinase MtrB [Arcanobacterium pinnipediorum]|uniref:Sensor histidine kinase MtrB n=1 Tax=Arcanobacterium pinnipediorum TaxID=1503041 RepID=A0ABY5AHD8_9ACTO|nr:MtrAB system histidine kinase MtrB [Arcanobacterium pinnipediorum]USR79121.1 MtrAB system histidine kinase MtrB [Arcanobacterium pinnipediorum]